MRNAMLRALALLVPAATAMPARASSVLQTPAFTSASAPRRAFVTLLYGDSRNSTFLVTLQARALSELTPRYDHIVLAAGIPDSLGKMISNVGS